jgi:hypothetical protein
MSQRIAKRWKSKFARFVGEYGATRIASELSIDASAIYHWIGGATTPRPAHAAVVQRLAHERGVRLTLDEIYRPWLEQQARAVKESARTEAPAGPLSVRRVLSPRRPAPRVTATAQ